MQVKVSAENISKGLHVVFSLHVLHTSFSAIIISRAGLIFYRIYHNYNGSKVNIPYLS